MLFQLSYISVPWIGMSGGHLVDSRFYPLRVWSFNSVTEWYLVIIYKCIMDHFIMLEVFRYFGLTWKSKWGLYCGEDDFYHCLYLLYDYHKRNSLGSGLLYAPCQILRVISLWLAYFRCRLWWSFFLFSIEVIWYFMIMV